MSRFRKYYYLEEYLFREVHDNFHTNKHLNIEEFLAIIVWKSNRSKTNILRGMQGAGKKAEQITADIFNETDSRKKFEVLLNIRGIGIPVASAILTVCYPKEFTVADYRAAQTISKLRRIKIKNPAYSMDAYEAYLAECKKLAKEQRLSLRETDRALWGFDLYNGINGVAELAKKFKKKSPITGTEAPVINEVLKKTAAAHKIELNLLMSKSRRADVVAARQTAMHTLRVSLGLSFPQIGQIFGFTHSTALYAFNRIEKMPADKEFTKGTSFN